MNLSIACLSLALAAADVSEPRASVSLELPGLFWNAVGVDGEWLLTPRWGLEGRVGVRLAAAGESTSWVLGAGLGARYYLGLLQWDRLGGPFVGLRWDHDWSRTAVAGAPHAVGGYTMVGSARAGYRLVLWRHLELVPEVGLALSTEFDAAPRLVALARLTAVFGFTVGYAF